MLKPGDPGGSAFLKVDPAYLQHWQQLFPHSQLKAGLSLVPLQPTLERPPELPQADSLRPRPASLASSSSSSSSASSSASLAALSAMPAVFGALQSPESSVPQPGSLRIELAVPKCLERVAQSRLRCSPEELDYYLYGQQRMEIIPLSTPTSDPNNRMYRQSSVTV